MPGGRRLVSACPVRMRSRIAAATCSAVWTGKSATGTTAVPATHLIELYAKWGYREVERCQWNDTNYESVIMKKDLRQTHAP